jgi:hypothetical protein
MCIYFVTYWYFKIIGSSIGGGVCNKWLIIIRREKSRSMLFLFLNLTFPLLELLHYQAVISLDLIAVKFYLVIALTYFG